MSLELFVMESEMVSILQSSSILWEASLGKRKEVIQGLSLLKQNNLLHLIESESNDGEVSIA